MSKNIITRGKAFNQSGFLDDKIEEETQRKIDCVDGAEDFGIRTACNIDGEFILVSNYDLPENLIEELKEA
jgi:hypothetical protein|tara:strand:- start:948 stop:1160 length:213 start_codon:yes stop_codon:yes gene_type:complete